MKGILYFLTFSILITLPNIALSCFSLGQLINSTATQATTSLRTTTTKNLISTTPTTKCQVLNCLNGGTFQTNTCSCFCYPSWKGQRKIYFQN